MCEILVMNVGAVAFVVVVVVVVGGAVVAVLLRVLMWLS